MHPFIQKIVEYIKHLFLWIQSLYDKPSRQIKQSPEKIFYDKEVEKFQKYELFEYDNLCLKNENIESLYYDIKEYTNLFQEPNNDHELKWKHRILYMTTPLGNIAMYYDPYKMGFAYYADQYIPYNILNVVSMRYVRMYRCMDFFMDEIIVKTPSKLIDIHKKEAPKSQPLTSNAFVKYRGAPNHEINSVKSSIVNTCRNTFIYLGKMRNLSFTQSLKKSNKQLPKFTSALLQNIDSHTNRLSYKEFMATKSAKN